MLPQSSAENYLRQQDIQAEALAAATKVWGRRPPRDFDSWFAANVDTFVAIVEMGQLAAVEGADAYVEDTLDALDAGVAPLAEASPAALIGVASDGRPLDSLMYGPVITAKGEIGKAVEAGRVISSDVVSVAWEAGLRMMQMRVQTQLADANRVATGLAVTTRPNIGYVRMLNPPSCSRCAVLAGKFFRYNDGFLRHPGCDCRHIPSPEDRRGDLRTDPMDYFASLDEPMQDEIFTRAGAQAVRDGADISQVVNARRGANGLDTAGQLMTRNVYGRQLITTTEGVTKRGIAGKVLRARGRNAATTPRLMPEDIYDLVGDDRSEVLRMLQLNGYVLERRGVPLSGAGSRTGLVPTLPQPGRSGIVPAGAASAPRAPGSRSGAAQSPAAALMATAPAPSGVVAPTTKTFLSDSELSLPYGETGWNGEAGVAVIRPRETRGARNLWRAETKVAELNALLAQIRSRSSRLGRGELNTSTKRNAYEAELRAEIAEVDGKLSRARSETSIAALRDRRLQLEQEIADIKTDRNASIDLLGAEDTVERARTGKVGPRDHEMMAELTEYAGQYDVNGRQIPSAALERHLDTVLAAGRALRQDIRRSFDTDSVLVQLRDGQRAAEVALREAESALYASGSAADLSNPLWKSVKAAKKELFGVEWDREVRRRESVIIRSALAEVRDFGGVEMPVRIGKAVELAKTDVSAGSARVVRDLRQAESFYPKDWLDRATDRGEMTLFQSDRAYFSAAGPDDRDMIAAPTLEAAQDANVYYDGAFDGDEIEIMVHELGHRMERAVPGLTELEFALVRRRSMTSGVLDEVDEFSPGEYSLTDQWTDPYTGKVYNTGNSPQSQDAHEAFQTGTQDLFGRGSRRFGDDELEEFMLGTLALL